MNKEECDNRVFKDAKKYFHLFPFYNVYIFITSIHFCNKKFKYGKTFYFLFSKRSRNNAFYFKNTKSVNVIHGQLGNITYIQESGEKLLISWQRLMLSGVLWFQETCDIQEHISQERSSRVSCLHCKPSSAMHASLSLGLGTLSLAFLSYIKGIIIGPSPEACDE